MDAHRRSDRATSFVTPAPVPLRYTRPGYALVVAYLITAMLAVWTFVSFQRSTTELRAADRWTTKSQAFQLAEAGIDRGIAWMNAQPSPPGGITPFDPFNGRQCVDAACQTWYQVSIDPDDNNPTRFDDLYTITVMGQTERIQTSRQVAVVLSTQSFSRYSYFTDLEVQPSGSPIWFTSRDVLTGPVHTKDRFNIAWNPVFNGPVSSARSSINYYNGGPPTDNPAFNGGLSLGAASVQLPLTVTPLRAAAASGGMWLDGNTTIVLQSDRTMRVTNPARGWTNVTMPQPANGAVFVNQGNLTVSGTVSGQLTLGTSNDVILNNAVRYANDPQQISTSTDLLGLVAEQNVVVSQSAPYDMTIQASVMALNESFTVESWWQGPPKGTLNVLGGLIQKRRGPVGTFSGTQKASGYSKNYVYDTRLMSMSPPFYPTTTQYVDALWQDQN